MRFRNSGKENKTTPPPDVGAEELEMLRITYVFAIVLLSFDCSLITIWLLFACSLAVGYFCQLSFKRRRCFFMLNYLNS